MFVKTNDNDYNDIISIFPNKPTSGMTTLFRDIGNHVVSTDDIISIHNIELIIYSELQDIIPEYLEYDYKDESKCQERLREYMGQYPKDIGKWGYVFIKHGGGYYRDTMQFGLTIAVPRRCSDKERIKEELTRAMEFVKPLEDGIKRISIFEHTLSEYASYNVIYDNGWAIERCRSYHQETSKTSLDEVVDKLVTKYWYNDPKEDE